MILKLKPVLFNKIWGGNKLKLNYNYPADNNCGEAWGISAHPHGSSIVDNSSFKGLTLKELFDNNKELFGNYPGIEFPILVKVIDAKTNLSIQVHPDNDYAKQFDSLGKEECWYILDTDPNTEIVIGHHAKSHNELNKAIDEDKIELLANSFPIKKDDYFYIDAGTLHAICSGTTLLEVQQSSDITYRVYDYKRKQDDGTYRDIHKEQAKDVITVPDNNVNRKHNDIYFTYDILTNATLSTQTAHLHGDYIFIIDGEGTFDKTPVRKGDFIMVTSSSEYEVFGNLTYQKTTF